MLFFFLNNRKKKLSYLYFSSLWWGREGGSDRNFKKNFVSPQFFKIFQTPILLFVEVRGQFLTF